MATTPTYSAVSLPAVSGVNRMLDIAAPPASRAWRVWAYASVADWEAEKPCYDYSGYEKRDAMRTAGIMLAGRFYGPHKMVAVVVLGGPRGERVTLGDAPGAGVITKQGRR